METKQINFLKELDGREVWTNAFGNRFGERVCVGIEYPNCWNDGKKFKPTKEEVKDLWNDMIFNGFGSQKQIMKDMEEEFGNKKAEVMIGSCVLK